MKNSFKKILTNHEVPKVLKNKILDDIGMIRLTFDIADIFLMKYPGTISDYYISQEMVKSAKK